MPITVIDKPTTINAIATGIFFSGEFSSLLRIMVESSFHCLENRASTTPPMRVTNSGSRFAATARRAQAIQVHRDGNANEESAECIEPIVIEGYVLAKNPRQQAENQREIGDGQQAPDLRVARTIE